MFVPTKSQIPDLIAASSYPPSELMMAVAHVYAQALHGPAGAQTLAADRIRFARAASYDFLLMMLGESS